MNKRVAILILTLLFLMPALCIAQELSVTLPKDYETSGQNYPVIYLMPEDGYQADKSNLESKLLGAMEQQLGLEMIIVRPHFSAQDDPAAMLSEIIEKTDAQYRTAKDPKYRVLMGTDVGGYMAYTLGLKMPDQIGAMVSIRGNFSGEDNPWLNTLGSAQDAIELTNLRHPEYFNTVYTYMDVPVDDPYSNQPGGTNELGAAFIGFGTGSASHEYTVRPGTFDDAFLTESVKRVMNRLTMRMLEGAVTGLCFLEKAAISSKPETVTVLYGVYIGEFLAGLAPVAPAIELVFTLTDPETGEILDQQILKNPALEGGCEIANKVNGTSSSVTLEAHLLNVKIPVSSATLIRTQEPILNGNIQKIDLMGDWQFIYTGRKSLNVPSLTKEEIASWSTVQPGITNWHYGFGNISEKNVTSLYGLDYFNFFITGNGYYAKTFILPKEFDSEGVLLSIGYVDDRCEVFFNGTRVGALGMDEKGKPTKESTWSAYSCFNIDSALLNRGGENTIVVRAWNDTPYGAGGWYRGPAALYSYEAFLAENYNTDDYFYEESFPSQYAAKALGLPDTIENKCLVFLPEGYENSGKRYPTVYLLHQYKGDHVSYLGDKVNEIFEAGAREGLFDEMIVVAPKSSDESWWTGDWEKMITEDLIPYIDGKYRTIRDARYRLTAGCSMGGQGAMAVALRNPDYFSGAVSFFGAFSYGGQNSPNAIAANESAEYMDSFSLYFICGNQDSYGFGVPAIDLHQQLEKTGVNHRFFIENGGHDSAFYIPFFKDAFAYVRNDMYKSDEAIESLIKGGLTVVGTQVTAMMDTLPGIEAYHYTVPASSYTKNPNPALNAALTITVIQNGKEVVYDSPSHRCADDFSTVIELDVAADIDASQPFEVILTASVLDRTIELARIAK